MNKDQVKGSVKDATGKAQEKMGKIVGSNKQQLKGIQKQVEGNVQKAVGDAKEMIDDANSGNR